MSEHEPDRDALRRLILRAMRGETLAYSTRDDLESYRLFSATVAEIRAIERVVACDSAARTIVFAGGGQLHFPVAYTLSPPRKDVQDFAARMRRRREG